MNLEIEGKVAMVAAASKGIGKAIAAALAAEGCAVSICSRSQEHLDHARREIEAAVPGAGILTFPCDVSRKSDLENWAAETRKQFGSIDILVTNTGGPPPGRFMELSEEQWQQGVQSTLMNVVRLCNLVLPGMQEQNWGRIVHVTSLAAKQPVDILSISNTLRAGISALTKTLSNEYAKFNITCNALLPGHILTDRQTELNQVKSKELDISAEEYAARVQKSIPARRYGQPQEIGAAAAFLCSEAASYINGVSLQVDGGLIESTF
ncbi:MAG: SDR family oxidoreductase [Calditrichia bacterium]